MSRLDSLKSLFTGTEAPPPIFEAQGPRGTVLDALSNVIDPELGIDIVNLGLVRAIAIEDDTATVGLVLTTPGCPVAGLLVEQIEQELHAAGYQPSVELLHDITWRPEDMSPDARQLFST